MDTIYLDNAATSFPKPEGVSDRMKYYLDCVGANVNRSVYTAAQEAGLTTLALRRRLAALFHFSEPPTHVILTPGATGGAVAQLMFLRHAGVPTGKAAVLVIVRTLLSILFLVLCMPFIFMHDAGIVPGISNDTLMAITLTAFVVIIAIVVGARRGYLDYLVVRIARHTKKERRCKIIAFYRDTKSAIALLAASPKAMLLVFAESGLNLLCIYAIVPCLLLGLGVTDADWYSVMGRMIFLNMLLYFTPTPGGSGIAEGGFVLLFSDTVPAGTVGIIAVCWRLIAEYIPFLIGLYYTLTVFGRDFLNRQLR